MPTPSEHLISAVSRHSVPQENLELDEFVDAVVAADLEMFVSEVFYDSNSNCCTFVFRYGLTETEPVAEQLLAIAQKSISQFEWFGSIQYGRGEQGH